MSIKLVYITTGTNANVCFGHALATYKGGNAVVTGFSVKFHVRS